MDTQTRILILEDNESDAVMVERALRKISALDIASRWVPDKASYGQALDEFVPDLILADYSLPNFDGLSAMAMARELFEHIPVIIVSGAIGEEVAIEALKAGATDYVLKDRLSRLGPVIHRALLESRQLQEKIGVEDALRRSEERFRTTFENAAVGIEQVTLGGRLLDVNPALCAMLGYTREELLTHTFAEITHPEDHPRELPLIEQLFLGEIPSYQIEKRYLCKRGKPLWVRVTSSLAQGSRSYRISVIENITARKQAQDELRASEERLSLVLESAQIGTWDWDLVTGELAWSARCLALFGLPPDTTMNYDRFLEAVHPDDRQCVDESVRRALEKREHYNMEMRTRWPDGSLHWVVSRGRAYYDEQSRAMRMSGAAMDITERKHAEEALRIANDQLREADRRKDEFLAMLAHELRNPLAPIRYAVQMLNMTGGQQNQTQKQRDVIDRQVSHMGRLLDDLLEVSRITRGKIQLRMEKIDLRTIIEQTLESMRALIKERRLQIWYQAPSAPLAVDGDPTRLEQILRNLMANAIKYTEPGGCIWMLAEVESCGDEACQAVLTVRDSGIGIAPEVLPRIFDLFAQADQTLDRAQGGLGIGLTMVKRLVELHGGHVEARSAGLGRGSEFIVQLPLAETVTLRMPEPIRPEHPTDAKAPTPTRRVLVVDDNEDSAASLGELLGLWGHEVQTAHDGLRALTAAREWQPEVILLDIGLPGMDGYEVARRLRQEPKTAEVWMVALTGYGTEEDRRRAQEAGFDYHLVKPVSLDELSDLLTRRAA